MIHPRKNGLSPLFMVIAAVLCACCLLSTSHDAMSMILLSQGLSLSTGWLRFPSGGDFVGSVSLSNFDILPTCHSFSIKRQSAVKKFPPTHTHAHTQQTIPTTRRRITAMFSEPKEGGDRGIDCNDTDDADDDASTADASSSIEKIQQRLVRKGLAFQQTSIDEESNMVRVPGCVATVYVVAKQHHGGDVDVDDTTTTASTTTTTTNRISLYGNADAILSRGLLSLLNDYVQRLTLGEVLELDPTGVADVLGVRPALSKGRNDGLANMLKIIQNQLKDDNKEGDSVTVNDSIDDSINDNSHGGDGEGQRTSSDEQNNHSSSSASSSLTTPGKKQTVALLLSGGVDSSVAFRLLLEQGYDVVPFYLKIWLEDELAHLGECPWEDDVNTCREVCDQVGIDLQIISLQDEYHQRVMQHTLNECSLGRTPNPDILCNSRVKFGCFLEYLKGLPNKFDYIASGHYAQVKRTGFNYDDDDNADTNGDEPTAIARLFRAPDPVKDQSYFLCALDQYQLSRLLFPIGHLEKTEVRRLAEEFKLPNRHRPDSQGLCFLGKVKFRDFMQIHLGEKFGSIVDAVTGETIGQHHGVWYHTVGQRKGIGPYLVPQASSKGPWYVVAKDPSQNIVFASNKYDEDVFVQARSEFHVENISWITGKEPTHLLLNNNGDNGNGNNDYYQFILKIRHGPKLAAGTLTILEEEVEHKKSSSDHNIDGEVTTTTTRRERNGGIVKLEDRDGGLAPGQYVVFYTEDAECLGGGIISERHWAKFLLDREEKSTIATS